jgi:hypothetical protein
MQRNEYIMIALASLSIMFLFAAWFIATDPAHIEAALYLPPLAR